MNSYERFETILNHQKPDKMPLYIPTIACSVASQILQRKAYTGGDSLHFQEELSWLDGERAHEEFVQKHNEDIIELYLKLGVDISRETWRCKNKPTKKLDEYTLLFGDENGPHIIKRFFPEYQSYGIMEKTTGPFDIDELKRDLFAEMQEDHKVTEDELCEIYRDQLTLKKMADPYFPSIIGALGTGFPMYDELWLELTALEPELCSDYFLFQARILKQHVEWLYKQGFKLINGGADIATNFGPIISPKSFKEIFVPALKLLSDECKKYGVFYCYKTDGNIWGISDYMFGDAGVQAYSEVDRNANMTVSRLREKYPDVIIVGNISSSTLSMGKSIDVRDETRKSLLESEGFNYIPGPSNAIVHGTPVENVYAMIEEIENYKPNLK